MSQPSAAPLPSDETAPFDRPVPTSHPDRSAALATLFGMQPRPIDHCRVLELGCRSGRNLISVSECYPESSFVGIDDSRASIEAGQQLAESLAVSNLDLRCASFEDCDAKLGKFDYIICHDVFSRVSPAQQDQILAVCRDLLNEQGVAYLSYNIFPGWHRRMTLRDLMLRHAPRDRPSHERLAKSQTLARFLSNALARQQTHTAGRLKYHADSYLVQSDGHGYHEDLEGDNRPLYFHEFAARAARGGLQYLGEAALTTMFASNFGPAVEQQLKRLATDVISAEQHMDVLRDGMFRQTLLCHDGISLARQVTHENLRKLRVRGSFRPERDPPDLKASTEEPFSGMGGLTISSSAPLIKAALYHLGTQWPRTVGVDELISTAIELSDSGGPEAVSDADRRALVDSIAKCMANGMIEPASSADVFVTEVSQRPQASRVARFEAQTSSTVTNRQHHQHTLDDDTRNIIQFLDGKHDHEALLGQLMAAVNRGDLSILIGGLPATSEQAVADTLRERLQRILANLAANALLVA